jgi:hypothetical protein
MNFPFFNRLQVKKIVGTSGEAGRRAETMLGNLLQELPELLMAYVADSQTGSILASYTANSSYNPNQLNLRTTKLLRTMNEALATGAWPGGPLTDVSTMASGTASWLSAWPTLTWAFSKK